MHENAHQRTGEEQQPRQPRQHEPEMRPMLGDEIEPADHEKPDQHDGGARGVLHPEVSL
jgi:hypothetical protein